MSGQATVTTINTDQKFPMTDANGKVTLISLANLKTALLVGMNLNGLQSRLLRERSLHLREQLHLYGSERKICVEKIYKAMKITKEQLKAIMPNIEGNIKRNKHFAGMTLDSVTELLNKYAIEFDITTPLRWAHYLAQIAHESMEFRYTEEIASGAKYDTGALATRLGNTPAKDGDGQKYKGRGLIQLTGKYNYAEYKKYCGFDVVKQPELLAQPVGAIRSSMWFWRKKNLNYYADIDALLTITKLINGGTNGYSERKKYLDRARRAI